MNQLPNCLCGGKAKISEYETPPDGHWMGSDGYTEYKIQCSECCMQTGKFIGRDGRKHAEEKWTEFMLRYAQPKTIEKSAPPVNITIEKGGSSTEKLHMGKNLRVVLIDDEDVHYLEQGLKRIFERKKNNEELFEIFSIQEILRQYEEQTSGIKTPQFKGIIDICSTNTVLLLKFMYEKFISMECTCLDDMRLSDPVCCRCGIGDAMDDIRSQICRLACDILINK